MEKTLTADCLAITNAKNETLWVRSVTSAPEQAAKALAQLRLLSTEPLTLLKSFTDAEGNEKHVELMTAWADACLQTVATGKDAPGIGLVEIWLDKEPMFGMGPQSTNVNSARFEHVASIWTALSDKAERMLDDAFALSQNIEDAWLKPKPCRSSSVGDVFVLRRVGFEPAAYRVASFGFTPIEFSDGAPVVTS